MQPLHGSEHYSAAAPLLNGTYARLRAQAARLVRVQFCCNDIEGRPTGRAVLATVGADLVHLDGPTDAGGRAYRADCHAVRVAGRAFAHAGYARHRPTGEWDEARFDRELLVPLLNHLRGHRWLCTAAPAALFHKWRSGGPIAEADVAG